MEHGLRPEAAAGVGHDHAHLVLGKTERRDQHCLGAMRHLRVDPGGQQAVDGIEAYNYAPRLDRMAAALVQPEALGEAMGRLGERAVDVAVVDQMARHQIVRTIEPRPRRTWPQSRARIEHHRQQLGFDLDQRRRVLCDGAGLSNHERDRLTDVANLLMHERIGIDVEADRAGRDRKRDAVAGEQRAQVGEREHRMNAGNSPRLRRVDRAQPRMRDRAAQHRHMQHAGQRYVVDEARGTAQQRHILDAGHRATKKAPSLCLVVSPAHVV